MKCNKFAAVALALTALLVSSMDLFAEKETVLVATPSLVATLPANRNYCPVVEGVGEKGRFGILLQTKIWYHGRTGNARRFYQDQDENMSKTVEYCRRHVSTERLKGFLAAPWKATLPDMQDRLMRGIDQLSASRAVS